jgi:tripartite-type tricarboxylate transporter receptor subunit TctC
MFGWRSLIAAVMMCVICGPLAAQTYPSKPVTIVIPSAPGGTSDLSGRIVSQYLTQELGKPFIADDHPGAGNTIGAAFVAHSAPDGYTLLITDGSHAISQSVYRHLPYDTATAFTHVALIARTSYVLVVNPRLGVKDLKGLVALAKEHPGKLTYSSAGQGTGSHLAMAMLARQTGMDLVHVPYKAGGPALTDVLTGQIDMTFVTAPASLALVQSGKLIAILSSDAAGRTPGLPNVPTAKEAGVADYSVPTYFGLTAPRGTPKAVVERLNRAINKMLAQPEVRAKFAAQGLTDTPMSAEGYAKLFNDDMQRWSSVVKAMNVHID